MPEPTISALVPLSLLEALRNLDTPLEDGLADVSPEVVAKRLGLSGTVAAQIERYQEGMERDEPVTRAEALGVFRLVGRRPDAALAFADAGRRAARHAARGAGRTQALARMAPVGFTRSLGLRSARKVAARRFEAEVRAAGAAIEARIASPLSIEALPDGSACIYFGALFAELLRCLGGLEGAMTHDRCRARGDQLCAWRWSEAEGYR